MNKKFEEVYNHVPNVPRGNVYNDSANNINNTSNSGNNGNAASSDNYTSSSNSNAGRVSFESTESLPAVRTEPVYNEAMNQAQPTSSSGGQVQQSSSSKQEERSLAQDAKEWHGRESRFVKGHDISYPSPYENINKQADKAFQAQSALPSTLAGIDVSGSNYKQLREGIVSKVGIGTASKETGKVIAENTGDLGKNINKDIYSNLKDLSNHYGASGDKGLIQEVQSSYTQSADGIKKVKDKITNENQNLSEQYQKETKWLIPVNVSPKIVESKKEDNKENK